MYVVEILASMIECILITRFSTGFLNFKSKEHSIIKCTVLFGLLLCDDVLLSQRNGYEALSIVGLFSVVLIYSLIFLKGNIFQKLLTALVPMLTILPINLLVLHLFSYAADTTIAELIDSQGSVRIMMLFFTKFIQFCVFERILKAKGNTSLSLEGSEWVIQLLCFGASFFISEFLWRISLKMDDSLYEFSVIYVLIILLNVLLYCTLIKIHNEHAEKMEYRLIVQNLRTQKNLLHEYEKRYLEMKTFKHDIKHHFSIIAAKLQHNETNEANILFIWRHI